MDILHASATTLAAALRRGELGSVELTRFFIDRIERFDGDLNAVVVRDFERALEAAERADRARSEGRELGPLHGLPMTIKEAFDVEGLPTTWGVPELAKNVATRDSAVTARLRAAGAHIVGKTNVPIHLGDLQSYNDIYGTTNNPWDTKRTPGGSSGGSAASLAAGLAPLDFGSDIGGSIRTPAHFCGVYGHKPTYAIVSQEGHTVPGMLSPADIAVVGPMARHPEDLALALDLTAGPATDMAAGWRLELPGPEPVSIAGLRVAVWPTDPVCEVGAAVGDRLQLVADELGRLGAKVSDDARPAFDSRVSHDAYVTLLNGQLSVGMPDDLFERLLKGAASIPAEQKDTGAQNLRALVQTHRTWLRANETREQLRAAWRAFFEDWDVLLCPQTPTTAFLHDHSPQTARLLDVDGKQINYLDQLFWAGLISVARLPSTVFPAGAASDGLPVGIQAVGAEYRDHACIAFARAMVDVVGGFVPPPGFE